MHLEYAGRADRAQDSIGSEVDSQLEATVAAIRSDALTEAARIDQVSTARAELLARALIDRLTSAAA